MCGIVEIGIDHELRDIRYYVYAYHQRVSLKMRVMWDVCSPASPLPPTSSLVVFASLFVPDLDPMPYLNPRTSFALDLCLADYTFLSRDRCNIREERKTYDIETMTVVGRDNDRLGCVMTRPGWN